MYPNHLFEALAPIFLVSNLMGTSPIYSQENNGKHSLKSSSVFQIITYLYLVVYTCSIIYSTETLELETNNIYFNNAMSIIGVSLDIVGQIILIYVIYIFSLFISKNVRTAIGQLANIDSILQDLGHVNNYKRTLWQSSILLGGGIFVIGYASLMHLVLLPDHSPFSTNQSLWFVYYFPNLTIFVMECQFASVIYLIYQRFQAVNEILQGMYQTNETNFKEKYSKEDMITVVQTSKPIGKEDKASLTLRKIETLMEVYDTTVDVASDINANYSFQILICLAVLFIKLIFGINFAYLELFILSTPSSAISWITWATMNTFEITLIVIPCYITTLQAQKTGVEVHKLLMNSDQNSIKDKLIIFSQQIFHCPVEFTACGLFPIDAPLLFMNYEVGFGIQNDGNFYYLSTKIVSAGTTYLLIMLQFQEGNETSCLTDIATAASDAVTTVITEDGGFEEADNLTGF